MLRRLAASSKVMGSILNGVMGISIDLILLTGI